MSNNKRLIHIKHHMTARLNSKNRKSSMIIGIIILGLGILASYSISSSISISQIKDLGYVNEKQLKTIDELIRSKLDTYGNLLIATGALLRLEPGASAESWARLYKNLRLESRNPELLAIGYVEYSTNPVDLDEKSSTIKFIAPYNDINQKAIGFDMLKDPTRAQAMKTTRETQNVVMSGPILAVQDIGRIDGRTPSSVAMYYPVYDRALSQDYDPNSVLGYTYAIFRVEDLFLKSDQKSENIFTHISIADTTKDKQTILSSTEKNNNNLSSKDTNLYSRKWTIAIDTPRLTGLKRIAAILYFVVGLCSSSILGLLVFLSLSKRSIETTSLHAIDLQSTKNELVALASHQLRTPATGVRQYIGMLNQGYFGKLNQEQQDISEKAYRANQRQLETIDQLLYVAKADAGQIMIQHGNFDIVVLLKSVIDGQQSDASKKDIRLVYKGRKTLSCYADEKFVRMMLENLLSNAIKYSYPKSSVMIVLIKEEFSTNILIKDRGVGISPEDQLSLFAKFNRIENPLSRQEGGSGLGLYLAQKLAMAHEGNISVKSSVTNGSTFKLVLPVTNNCAVCGTAHS
jgi:signal transduction histidine kinase/ribosomal protein S13